MGLHLVVAAGPDKGRQFSIEEGQQLLVGRSQDADIQLSDGRASRKHCEARMAEGDVRLTDLDSAGGTFVNGNRIDEGKLKPGDLIRVGETEIRLQLDPVLQNQSTMVSPPTPPTSARTPVPAIKELPGQTIHLYSVDCEIGQGQNATVFLAHHTEKQIPLVLKVLSPEIMADEEDRQRFVRSMKTMIPIRDLHLVEIYNAGIHRKMPWIAMEYVKGESLTQVIERIGTARMLDWEIAFRVAAHMCHALGTLAEHQILHRNITPPNILIRHEDKCTKLGDSLLAKSLHGTMAQQITRPGQLIGDLAYMPPERTATDADYDTRSDLYSLGATVYALLTGRPPFEAASLPELVRKIRKEEPVRPTKYQLSINKMFEGTVIQMLQKKPEDRYQTPAALSKDLERIANYQNIKM